MICFLQHFDEIFGLRCVGLSKKRVGRAGPLRPGRSADPVDIILSAVGIIEVDDELDVLNVDSSSGNVGGDENVDIGTLELVQNVFTLVLLLVTVDRRHFPPFSTHRAHKVVRSALGLGEDESLIFFLLHDLLHQLRQFPVFLVIRADVGDLQDVVVSSGIDRTDGHVARIG